ncbi:MAG: hypothetical protein QOF36_2545 [Microbacteriaceae bacterium]|jgi:hypothetical protein|nr:hypothetical protein [Microbacteriaceae bacterium]
MDYGIFPLKDASALPNVSVAHPGEVWTRGVASGAIRPGQAVVPVNRTVNGRDTLCYKAVGGSADVSSAAVAPSQVAIAMRKIEVPDQNSGSQYNEALGPNQIVNLPISDGDYVRTYFSGAFHLTQIVAADYKPGDRIGYDPAATPQTGKVGPGAWRKSADAGAVLKDHFEVIEFRRFEPAGGVANEGILTVRKLGAAQF